MYKKISTFLLFTLFVPFTALSATSSEDLSVELPDDFSVKAGEEFSIPVEAAYDMTEECSEFLYDWRQTEGTKVLPLNDDVMEPIFQINTPGTYTFSLTIETRCNLEEGESGIVSDPDEISIIVEELTPAEQIEWTKEFAPNEISLPADGLSRQVFNLFLIKESGEEKEYPSGERVEFLLRTNDELLQDNPGKIILSKDKVEEGILTVSYFAPYISDSNFSGGTVTLQGVTAHGTAEAKINLTKPENTLTAELNLSQIINNPPYLMEGIKSAGYVSLDWADGTQSYEANIETYLNGEKIDSKQKTFYNSYTKEQENSNENYYIFEFTPTGETQSIEVKLNINGKIINLTKELTVRSKNDFTLPLYALKEGEWSSNETIDLESDLSSQLNFLKTIMAVDEIKLEDGDLNSIKTISRDEITENSILITPPNFEGTLPDAPTISLNGNRSDLARAYFSHIDDITELPSTSGVRFLDNQTKIITSEEPTIFTDPLNGLGLPYDGYQYLLSNLAITPNFPDLNSDHWATLYIEKLVKNGVVKGYSDGTVRPNDEVSRAEFTKMLLSAGRSGVGEYQGNTLFSDVSADAWFSPYVEFALRKRVIKGYEDNTFRPHNPVSRSEAVKILAIYTGLDIPSDISGTSFIDVDPSAWYTPYVQAVYNEGIVSGYSDGSFRPAQSITRAEAAKIIASVFYE